MPKLTPGTPTDGPESDEAAPAPGAADEPTETTEEASPAKKKAAAKKAAATKKAAAKAEKPEAAPRRARLIDQGRPLSERRDHGNILYAGDGGTGKTTNALALANLGRVLAINAEGGIKKAPLEARGINTDNIVVLPEDPADLSFDYLEQLFWEVKADLDADPDSWAGVVWDSITEIHIALLANVVSHQNDKARKLGQSRTKGNSAGDLIDRFFTDLSDYGVMTEQVRQLLRKYRDLPCHLAVTALLRRELDDDGRVAYRPYVTPALAKDLIGYMDVIGITEVADTDQGERFQAKFTASGKYRGKDRFSVLPRVLVTPTAERVIHYIHRELDAENDGVQRAARAAKEERPVARATADA